MTQAGFDPMRSLKLHTLLLVLLVVGGMMGAVALVAYKLAQAPVTDELNKKAATVASSVGASLAQAQQVGVDLTQMPGINEHLSVVQRQVPGVAEISVQIGERQFASSSQEGAAHVPAWQEKREATAPEAKPGIAHVRVDAVADPRFTQRVLLEMATDFFFILIAVLVITTELTHSILGASLVKPVSQFVEQLQAPGGRAALGDLRSLLPRTQAMLELSHLSRADRLGTMPMQVPDHQDMSLKPAPESSQSSVDLTLGGLRLPFFLIMLADDLSRGFLPTLSANLSQSWTQSLGLQISPGFMAGLPLAVFMLCVALTQPLLARWIDQRTPSHAVLWAAALAGLAHGLCALQTQLIGMVACRAIAGVAWAIAFMAVQAHILTRMPSARRAQALRIFVMVIMASLVCGPSLGGMLADAYGERNALGVALVLCAAAFALMRTHQTDGKMAADAADKPTAAVAAAAVAQPSTLPAMLARNGMFWTTMLFSAVPAKLLLVGYCFYMAPLVAVKAGYSAAMAGRLMMLYALLMIVCIPLTARLAAGLGQRVPQHAHLLQLSLGMLVAAAAGLAFVALPGMVGPAVTMALLGVAHAISTTPQAGMVMQTTQRESAAHGLTAVFSVYRLMERSGSALGALVFATLIALFGATSALSGLAVASLSCSIVLALALARQAAQAKRAAARRRLP